MGLFTTNEELTSEVNEIFNYLTGFSLKIDYSHLLVAPINAKSNFIGLINNQIKRAKSGKRAYIFAKMNSLEDPVLIENLYKASQANVKITLIIRGFCCLIPGQKGLSENINVISIIGRFLEHSRIFYFQQGEEDWNGQYFIGSADWMHRNMHSRVEVITPLYSEVIQSQLSEFFNIMLNDQRSAWDLKSNGTYIQRKGAIDSGTHDAMMKLTNEKIKKLEFN